MPNSAEIGTRDCPACEACGAAGKLLYDGLVDVLFDVPGRWGIRQCVSASCGMLWLDPMPLEGELHKAYRSYSTHHDMAVRTGLLARMSRAAGVGYRARRFGYRAANASGADKLLGTLAGMVAPLRLQMEFPLSYFDGAAKGRLLEIGCGGGDSLRMFADWGWITEGLDFDQAAVANARAKGLSVHQGDVFSCNYQANSFDAIYSSHVIEHVPQPRELLAECSRILKPGGRCVMLTPNANSIGHQRYKAAWRGLEPPRHLHIFTTGALAKLAHDAGFSDFQVTTSSRLAAAMYIQSALTRRNGKPGPRAPLDVKVGSVLVHLVAYMYQRLHAESGEELVFVGYKSK